MKIRFLIISILAIGFGFVGQTQLRSATADQKQITRGRYLAHDVAKCIECHSPRDAAGNIIEDRLLQGAPVPVLAPYSGIDWAVRAPHLAGLPGFSDEQVMEILMKGRASDRVVPRSPMPQYQLTREDAAAVVAYLRSL